MGLKNMTHLVQVDFLTQNKAEDCYNSGYNLSLCYFHIELDILDTLEVVERREFVDM